jgi:hypothetical protein
MRYRIKGEGGRRKGDEGFRLPEIDREVLQESPDYPAFFRYYRSMMNEGAACKGRLF